MITRIEENRVDELAWSVIKIPMEMHGAGQCFGMKKCLSSGTALHLHGAYQKMRTESLIFDAAACA